MNDRKWLMFVLLFAAPAFVRADDAALPWPPELPGARSGTVSFSSPALLAIPQNVREAAEQPGAAPFDVAKQPPTVHLAFHNHLGPTAATRRLWSSWGDICVASDGRVYCGIGDHADDVGGDARCFVYCWEKTTNTLKQVVDMNQVVPPRPGRPAWSKIHAKIDEGRDGKIYFSCTLNAGDRAKLPTYHWDDELPGGQLYQYDPSTGRTKVFANLPPKRCTATSLLDRERNIWWCNLEAGDGNTLWGLDLSTGKEVFQGPDGSVGLNRAFALMRDGSIYFNGPERMMRLNFTSRQIEPTKMTFGDSPGMRCATGETSDHCFYGITQGTHQLFRYCSVKDELTLLGPGFLSGSYTTVIALSPGERFLYYLPGAHGRAPESGTPVVRYELATGKRTVLAFLAPYCEREYGYVPAGTYGMKLSADGGSLYVNFNGHQSASSQRPKHLKPSGFGLTAFAEIQLPDE